MNMAYSIRLPDGSLTLVGVMRTSCVLPCDVESPHRVPEVLIVVVGIYVVRSSKVFISTIFMSSALFISMCEVTITVMDSSNDS